MSQTELANRTGMSLRTIQNYELGTRLPKSRGTYDKLAEALDMDVNILLDDSAEFVLRASEKYGGRGGKQAWDTLRHQSALGRRRDGRRRHGWDHAGAAGSVLGGKEEQPQVCQQAL